MSDKHNADDLVQFDLSGFTPYRVAVAAQVLSETLARQYRDRFGITIPEWRVLVQLAHTGGASVRDIEDRAAMEKSKVSRTASRLEGRGLVEKRIHPGDKRLVQLSLSDTGRAMMAEILPLASDHQARIEAELGMDFDTFDRALQTIMDTYG